LDPSEAESPYHHYLTRVNNPFTLRTSVSPPIRNLESLRLTLSPMECDDTTSVVHLQSCLRACFKAHIRTIRFLLKHVRNQRRVKYGKALLRVFITKPKVALQSILRKVTEKADSQPLTINLFVLREESTGRLLMDPEEVIAQIENLEIKAMPPDPTLPLGAPFTWLALVSSS